MEEERNTTSNLVQKRREVIKSSKILNLVQKRGKASTRQESQTSCETEREYYSKPRAKEERNITSNLVRKRKEVIGSSKTLNLVQKRVRVLIYEEF